MKKYKYGLIILLLFVLGVFSVTLTKGDFFFTTKYYTQAIDAFNSDCAQDAINGDISVEDEIGIVSLDDNICLFIGEISEEKFVVAEMDIKNNRYASKGNIMVYDYKGESDGTNSNITVTDSGNVRWSVLYDETETQDLLNAEKISTYKSNNGNNIIVVVYKN